MIERAEIDQALGGLTLSVQKVQKIAEEYQKLLNQVKVLTDQRDRLEAELSAVKAERDEFDNAIRFLTRREYGITVEELEEAKTNGSGPEAMEAFLRELEAEINAQRP